MLDIVFSVKLLQNPVIHYEIMDQTWVQCNVSLLFNVTKWELHDPDPVGHISVKWFQNTYMYY